MSLDQVTYCIRKVLSLQEGVESAGAKIALDLKTADEFVKTLKAECWPRFVIGNVAYKFEHRANGYGVPGNRDWLVVDSDTRVIG